jgi:hypothetical protein
MLTNKCDKRLELTIKSGKELRLEKLSKIRNLCSFEKWVLIYLVGCIISEDLKQKYYSKDSTIGFLLWILCDSLKERINHRSYFYKNSILVSDGMIRLSTKISYDLNETEVDIDRRMLDYIVGLDCEFSELVDGSHLYLPVFYYFLKYQTVKLENVIIPEKNKFLITETVKNFETFKHLRKKFGFDDIISYGKGLVLLFYGESGTGKTFLANGIK